VDDTPVKIKVEGIGARGVSLAGHLTRLRIAVEAGVLRTLGWKRKIRSLLAALLFSAAALRAADSPWQMGRIVDVETSTTKPPVWIVNTPIPDDRALYTIRVHVGSRIYQGTYTLDRGHQAPPTEWAPHAPVLAQFVGNTMVLKAPVGKDYRLRVVYSRGAPKMDPWSAEEIGAHQLPSANKEDASRSLIGFDDKSKSGSPPTERPATAATPAEEPPTGMVTISSMPYLAEVFVDGMSMGYTPAKLKLPPGKHSLRCEKHGYKTWTKDVTVTADTELTIDATLSLGHK
jgi:hypothetical protein